MIAYILAGGKGSRLEPWKAPKCLLPINGVPILHRIWFHIAPHVDKAFVCVGHRADDVINSMSPDWWLVPSNAGEDATMIERLLQAKPIERALVIYGDELADVDIKALVKDHERSKAFMTITAYEERLPFGVFNAGAIVEGQRVRVNIGYAVVEPQAWKYADGCAGLSDFFNKLRWCVDRMDSTNVYEHTGKRATINNPSDIARAEELFK